MSRRALLVEDDAAIATVITAALEEEAFAVDRCEGIAARDRLLAQNDYDVMLTDVMLIDGDGIESLPQVQQAKSGMPIIILSAQNTLDTAVRASDTGAFEYFPKPFDLDELVRAACQAADARKTDIGESTDPGEGMPLIGRSQAMQDVYRMIARVLRNDLTVLILGESGTGKELVAEAIHTLGARRDSPFVAVNTGAIPRDLVESELFGHEKGAFTGATSRNIGKFEQADGGTLFLDEIGDMPPDAQTRLLRALQSGRFRRVGGRDEIAVNVRIVAATNRDLQPMIASGKFREDLYYRLNVVPIQLPPLRDRTGDVAALVSHFLHRASAEGLPRRRMSKDALALLETQPWRGNVRELQNFVFRAVLVSREEEIDERSVRSLLQTRPQGSSDIHGMEIEDAIEQWLSEQDFAHGELYPSALAVLEAPVIRHALSRTGGNQLRAAQLLGINRNTLRKRLSDLGIEPESFSRSSSP